MDQNPYKPSSSELEENVSKKKGGFFSLLRKLLMVLGIIFGLLILLFVWVGISTSKTKEKFEGSAEPFINEFILNQNPWSYELAKTHLSPAWLETTSDEQGAKLFSFFSKLGELKSIDSIQWQGCVKQTLVSVGKIERCNYLVAASYEADVAQIFIGLSLEAGELKILQLRINSNAFIQ